jgi:hypothetical protein
VTAERRIGQRWIWLLLVSLQLPALRPLFKDVPASLQPVVLVVLALAAGGCFLLLRSPAWLQRLSRVLDTPWPALVILGLCTAAVVIVYPRADALKLVGRGSDEDDALIAGAAALLHGSYPYAARTYLGNPISPGPGWILLVAPLVATHVYWLLSPIGLALAACSLRVMGQAWRPVNLFLILMGSSLAFWELLVVGSDLIAIGCILLALVGGLQYFKRAIPVLAVVAGMLATSRIAFFYVPVIFGLMLWRTDRRDAVVMLLVGSAICFGLHGWFWHLHPEDYTPLHLVAKGRGLLSGARMVGALLACAGAGLVILRMATAREDDRLMMLWLSLGVPALCLALADLAVNARWSAAAWGGASYLVTPLPLLVAWVALQATGR